MDVSLRALSLILLEYDLDSYLQHVGVDVRERPNDVFPRVVTVLHKRPLIVPFKRLCDVQTWSVKT